MPKSVLQFNPAGTLTPEDVLYLIQGTGLGRDRKVTLEAVRAWMNGLTTVVITLAGDDTVDYSASGNGNSLLILSGSSATPYTLTLSGTPPIPGQKTTIANMSVGTVALDGALFVPGTVRILPGETAQLEWNSDISAVVQVGSTEASVAGRLYDTVSSSTAYDIGDSALEYEGDIVLATATEIQRLPFMAVRAPGYEVPTTGLLSPKWMGASAASSFDDSLSELGSITMARPGIESTFSARFSLGFKRISIAKSVVVSSSRPVAIFLATEQGTTDSLAKRITTVFMQSAVGSLSAVGVASASSNGGFRRDLRVSVLNTLPVPPWDNLTHNAVKLDFYKHDGAPYTYAEMLTDIGVQTSVDIRFIIDCIG